MNTGTMVQWVTDAARATWLGDWRVTVRPGGAGDILELRLIETGVRLERSYEWSVETLENAFDGPGLVLRRAIELAKDLATAANSLGNTAQPA